MSDTVSLADLRDALREHDACAGHPALHRSESPEEAALWHETIQGCSAQNRREHLRWFAKNDLFFLAVYILHRKHFIIDDRKTLWTFQRCKEVQDDPDNHLDLWPRESYKSEIISFCLTIQDIINDPEVTFGYFSHTRPIAATFVKLIKVELETNELLYELFPQIFWQNPKTEAIAASSAWSSHAITVKRKGNLKQATVEAWGLVDGQPVSARFKKLNFDDVVSRDSISADMIHKTTTEFKNSLLLTASDPPIFRYIATFQEIGDTTQQLVAQHFGKLRKISPFDESGKPAFCSDEKFAWFKQNLDPKTFALQILLDPQQSKNPDEVGFNNEWMDYYDEEPVRNGLNVYVLVDPAGNSPESNSRFAMWVVGLRADKRVVVLDLLWDKYDLEERWQAVFNAVQQWEPLKVGYEKYAMQADIEHFRFRQKQINFSFPIVELGSFLYGGGKDARIGQLIPWFRDKRFLFPKKGIRKKLKDGTQVDLVTHFIDQEFSLWPYNPRQRDLLDALSRITDPNLNIVWPRRYGAGSREGGFGDVMNTGPGGWMSQ
jgi:hypothetical protein